MPTLWIFPVLIGQRLFELWLSRRNAAVMRRSGGREFHPVSFRLIAGLHTLFLASLFLESRPFHVPADWLTWVCLIVLTVLQGIRYWSMATLGCCWNTRIVAAPGVPVKRTGPYRFLRHPNYLVVALEFVLWPVLMRAFWTLAIFPVLNLFLLRQRIRLEEKTLREVADCR